MVGRDPARVVSLVGAASSTFTTGKGFLLQSGLDLLGTSGLLSLGEKCLEVGRVDEVAGTSKCGGQEEVQEDTGT